MKLEDLQKVWNSLAELSPDVTEFSGGPSYALAVKRLVEARKLIKHAILKAEDKEVEFQKIKDEIEEFIAEHDMSNQHYLDDAVIIEYFDYYTPKQVKKALKDLR